jgi:predicted Ser/Thr protein kinase
MARNPESLKKLLQLTPLASKSITFETFLLELNEHPGRADSAAAVLFRAVIAMGEEDIESEPSAKRRQYLRMLKDLGIPALKAFRHVAGSQRFATQPLSFLRSAGDGGAQRLQMIIFDGGPGCGKDYFKDGIVNALEFYTEEVEKIYAVKGCPHNENPINLLKLLKPEQLKGLAAELEIPDLAKVVDLACEPCPACYKLLMGTVQEPNETPCFGCIEVVPMRVSSRSTGIADWQPGGKVSLVASLRKANRGFISMPDAFIERESRPGETDERLVLLDVTQYHRLPGETDADGNVSSNSPHDAIILATTNRNALDNFLDSVPDKGAFTSRAAILRLPYNTIRCEEVRAYESELKKYRNRSHFDPLVLEVIATLAVLSRLAKPRKKGKFVHPLDILKLYQGDSIQPKLRSESDFNKVWEASSSGSYSHGGKANNWGPAQSSDDDEVKTLAIPDDMPITTDLLWSIADPEEGMNGLDMRLMMGLLSSINQLGLKKPGKEKCVSSLEVLGILRAVIAKKAKATNTNTKEQQEVYDRCLKWLGGAPVPGAEPSSTPDIIESEYRLMLRDMLLGIFAPDYEARAQKLFADYRLHATALMEGKPTIKDPQLGTIPASAALVDELDRHRVGKGPKEDLTEKDKAFRGQLDSLISIIRDDYNEQQHGKEAVKPFKVNWDTIPDMAIAIRGKLDTEVGKLIDKLITTEVKSDLNTYELEQLELAEKALQDLGFRHGLHKPILEYAKRTKVWSFKLS